MTEQGENMSESRDYLELTFRSINCFADDGRIDADELKKLYAIAEKDGVVDDNEKRVLKNIISRVKESEMDTALQETINAIEVVVGK
jgi:hypothetical protein